MSKKCECHKEEKSSSGGLGAALEALATGGLSLLAGKK